MALNHDLVTSAFSTRDPMHVRILADHADESGHPELADAFRNEAKSVNPYPWYDDEYVRNPRDPDYGETGEDGPWTTPLEHLTRIKKKGLQLAPGIFALRGYDGFGPAFNNPANNGFHVYDLRGLDTEYNPEKKEYRHGQEVPDSETFQSRAEYNAALEEYFAGRGAPRFFPHKGKLELSRASALTDQLSMQQRIRRALAVKIAREARLRLLSLADGRSAQNAGVLQTYGHDNDPKGVEYAAAWYGMLTKAPNVTAFHVHEGGPDTFHTWTTTMNPDDTLRVAGNLPAVVTSDGRVSIFDQGNKFANSIAKFKEASFAQNPQAEPGTAVAMPGREAFRQKIREYQGGE